MIHDIAMWLVEAIGYLSYTGVFLLMFLESSLFPFPSEVVVPPAGYLAAQGRMDLTLVILAGTGGSLMGALFNYWLALLVGRPFLDRYGKYLFIKQSSLQRAEEFFSRHGHISTFIARLVPGIRQLISLPAGLSRMNLFLFCLFTSLGAGCWVFILALIGYWFGHSTEMVSRQLQEVILYCLLFSGVLAAAYILLRKRRNNRRG